MGLTFLCVRALQLDRAHVLVQDFTLTPPGVFSYSIPKRSLFSFYLLQNNKVILCIGPLVDFILIPVMEARSRLQGLTSAA